MKIIVFNVNAEIRELRFCSKWTFKHAPPSRLFLCVSWAFLVGLFKVTISDEITWQRFLPCDRSQ